MSLRLRSGSFRECELRLASLRYATSAVGQAHYQQFWQTTERRRLPILSGEQYLASNTLRQQNQNRPLPS
jgi:hypothetical protein